MNNSSINPKDLLGEIWLPVVGAETHYLISNLGRLKSIKKDGSTYLRKPSSRSGYYRTRLSVNNNIMQETIHRLVAKAFIPNPENKPVINHKNSNRLDNRVENLEWCTQAENLAHAISVGNLKLRGKDNANSILTEADVLQIREEFDKKQNGYKAIADKYGVHRDTIYRVVNKINWSWL